MLISQTLWNLIAEKQPYTNLNYTKIFLQLQKCFHTCTNYFYRKTLLHIHKSFHKLKILMTVIWFHIRHPSHPSLCCKAASVSERRGGAALWEDNVRRLSNPAIMTVPLAILLDYQAFAASVTSAGSFTMETPHHSPPTAAHYRDSAASAGPGSAHLSICTWKLTHCLLL